MAQVGFGVTVTGKAGAILIYRGKISRPFLVFDIDHPIPGEQHPITSVTGWHYTVEHIHAQGNVLENVPGSTYSHQVTGLLFREYVTHQPTHFIHILFRFSYAQATDSITCTFPGGDLCSGDGAQVFVGAALYNGEKRL